MTTIIIPTWSNLAYLINTLESLFDLTRDTKYRVIVIDNGSTDDTPVYLADVRDRHANLTIIRNEENVGFVRAMNQGLAQIAPGENVLWLNDDIQITDPYWLARMENNFQNPQVGAVGAVSNFVMGLQQFGLSSQIPHKKHFTNFLIGYCLLVRADAFQVVGKLDERFLMGGNDDLDYSLRLTDAGYRLLIDREVFVFHYGARSISRIGGYEKVEKDTRPLLIAKWGAKRVDALFTLPKEIQ